MSCVALHTVKKGLVVLVSLAITLCRVFFVVCGQDVMTLLERV